MVDLQLYVCFTASGVGPPEKIKGIMNGKMYGDIFKTIYLKNMLIIYHLREYFRKKTTRNIAARYSSRGLTKRK